MVRLGLRSALVLGVAAATIGVGTLSDGTLPAAQASELPAFGDCDELADFYRQAARAFVTPYGLGGSGVITDTVATPIAAARTGAEAGALDAVGNGPTGTNVQEAGVDEPDSAKTDGEHVITVYGGRLRVVDVTGNTPVLVGRLRLPKTDSSELLLVGDRAVVFGTGWDAGPGPVLLDRAVSHPGYGGGGEVVISIVDLSDPGTPRLVGSQRIEGSYVSARAYGDAVRVVVSSTPRLRFDEPDNYSQRGLRRAYVDNLRKVNRTEAADWLPQRELRDASGRVVGSGPLLSCTDVRHPRRPAGLGTLSVLTFDPAHNSAEEVDRTAVVADGDLVYSSVDRLYVATTAGGWLPWPVLEFGRSGAEAPTTSRLIPPRPPSESTTLHAFDVSAGDATTYVGSGAVPGRLLGRWALSEYDGHLRVATTTSGRWPAGRRTAPMSTGQSESHVVVLEERGDRLVQIGRVGGLGRGEQIRAVRWFGDLATVVTFRQTDPLYTVDLSNPEQPRVVGELKIPGYSAYLHPLGGDLLLGVGQDANRFGAERGVQISAFDLSDLGRPTRVDALDVGADYTQVQDDSRAFTYLPERRLAVLPVEGYRVDASAEVVSPVVQAVGVSVDADGELRVVGKVEVAGGAYGLRVLPVGDSLVAVTSNGLSVVDPADLEVTAQLRF